MRPVAIRLSALALLGAAWLQAQPHRLMSWPVRGTREMVAAANNLEAEAGFRMLAMGGNAVDAGVAATLAAAVTEQARFGLGGEMPLLIKMAGKPVVVVDGVGIAPEKATPEFFRARSPERWEQPDRMPPIPANGLHAAITPGVLDGLLLALEHHGAFSFEKVATPAAEYAAGFPLMEEFAGFIRMNQKILELWPTSKSFFLPNGAPPRAGDLFRATDLANTLQELIRAERKARGNRARKIRAVRDYFYQGPIAKKIADFNAANNGLIALEDLKRQRASFDDPRFGDFHGYQVVKPGFWTQGPVMIQALNILEGYDLRAMGHNSPQYLHTVIEAVKLAFADRDRYYGDPKFSKIPEVTLLSKEYGAERRKLIDPGKASMEHRPGSFAPPLNLSNGPAAAGAVDQDTTCVNVIDRWGNAFSATPSGAWLPSVIVGDTGIPLSTRLQSFVLTTGHANLLAPGKRPRVTLSPTLVLKDGKPFMAMSTPGGDNQDQAMLQVLLNIIVFGMSAQEAVEAPRFQTEHFYTSFASHEFTPGRVALESRMPASASAELARKGHLIDMRGDWSNASAPTVILVRPDTVLDGGADPRRGRYIMAR